MAEFQFLPLQKTARGTGLIALRVEDLLLTSMLKV